MCGPSGRARRFAAITLDMSYCSRIRVDPNSTRRELGVPLVIRQRTSKTVYFTRPSCADRSLTSSPPLGRSPCSRPTSDHRRIHRLSSLWQKSGNPLPDGRGSVQSVASTEPLVRAASSLLATPRFDSVFVPRCREESRHGTHECVRHIGRLALRKALWRTSDRHRYVAAGPWKEMSPSAKPISRPDAESDE